MHLILFSDIIDGIILQLVGYSNLLAILLWTAHEILLQARKTVVTEAQLSRLGLGNLSDRVESGHGRLKNVPVHLRNLFDQWRRHLRPFVTDSSTQQPHHFHALVNSRAED